VSNPAAGLWRLGRSRTVAACCWRSESESNRRSGLCRRSPDYSRGLARIGANPRHMLVFTTEHRPSEHRQTGLAEDFGPRARPDPQRMLERHSQGAGRRYRSERPARRQALVNSPG